MQEDSLVHEDETVETLCGGRLRVIQKKRGYRYTIDSFLLAGFVEPKETGRILELGAGSAVISLLLAHRHRGLRVTAVEVQAGLADMARRSVSLNGLDDRVTVLQGDIRKADAFLDAQAWDAVLFNPPYRKLGTGRVNPLDEKALSRHEIAGSAAEFLRAASHALKTGGRACLIYPCSRMAEVIHGMRALKLEPKRIRLVHSKPGSRGDFFLADGLKGGGEELTVLPPLYIYGKQGGYSEEMVSLFRSLADVSG
ncbi:MAG: tRNA1(Val) (adenine(37)-N6)-methyltransferase [Syntrophaceae bacterium]|nr:tRNA1(Val) (adenine(37)-N6)-methyltransferase [Syntrophaceae bacterium]